MNRDGKPDIIIAQGGLYGTDCLSVLLNTGQASETGTITVTTNNPSATFMISGPTTFSDSGLNKTYEDVPAGTYTIIYGALNGYTTPNSQTMTLSSGDTVAFTGSYTPISLELSKTTLLFNEQKNQPVPTQHVTVSTNGSAVNFSATVTGAASKWLSVSPSSGTTPATLTISILSGFSQLAPGSYIGGITIASPGATNSPQNLVVGLEVVTGALPSSSSWVKLSGPWGKSCDGTFGAVAVDPSSSKVIYLGSSSQDSPCGIFKSTDGGKTWAGMNSTFPKVIIATPPFQSYPAISKIAVAPSNPKVIYVGTIYPGGGFGTFLRSDNGGGKWSNVSYHQSPSVDQPMLDFTINPSYSAEVVVGTSGDGLLKTVTSGGQWSVLRGNTNVDGSTDNYYVVRFAEANPSIAYAAEFNTFNGSSPFCDLAQECFDLDGDTPYAPFELQGGSSSFTFPNYPAVSRTGITPLITDIAISPTDPNTFYACTRTYAMLSIFPTPAPNFGVFKTTDGGRNTQCAAE